MTVFELRQTLLTVDQNKKVWLVFAEEGERRPATCITSGRYGIHILDTDGGIPVSERIIFDECALGRMAVLELRKSLLAVDQNKQVWMALAMKDERPATCITYSRYGIHILDTDGGIPVSERIIFDECAQDDG